MLATWSARTLNMRSPHADSARTPSQLANQAGDRGLGVVSRLLDRPRMKKLKKKLDLNSETIRVLENNDLSKAAGGWVGRPPLTWSCPPPKPTTSAACHQDY